MTTDWCDCGRLNQDPCDVCRSLACEDAPKLAQEMAHANIGSLLYQLRDTIDQLIAIRVREFGPLLEGEEGELINIASSLNFLLTDLHAARAKKTAYRIQDDFRKRMINGQAK